ncbi:general secretion pathway protein GspK [Chitinilyticum litopenaei]|uniref:general secretion pathway protein GspK n=1 Tax=Chitinilyticum litopenaei TaxID=1121276 RepID=UPI0004129C10|nr:type II secretion system protein GspK [Chitinilyticum litopenaei]
MRRQRGLAIVVAMVIAALIATGVSWLVWRQSLWLRQIGNQQDLAMARSIARSALDLARLTLRDDAARGQSDDRSEVWTLPSPAINVDSARARGQISDEQGRLNLAMLLDQNGGIRPERKELLGELCTRIGVSCPLDRLLALLPGRRPSPLRLPGLLAEAGFSPADIERLRPLLTWLPADSPLNVNFARPELLALVQPGLSAGTAQGWLASLRRFASLADFQEACGCASPARWPLGVGSRYVVARIEVELGQIRLSENYLLDRTRAVPAILDQYPSESSLP